MFQLSLIEMSNKIGYVITDTSRSFDCSEGPTFNILGIVTLKRFLCVCVDVHFDLIVQ